MFGNFDLVGLLYRLPAVLISLSFHEWAHAYAAYKNGDSTARDLGRMTLNPFAHIDPVGFICLILFRFGWAKPVPVNSRNYTNYKKGTIAVSLAGISANFLLAIVSTLVLYLYAIYVANTGNYSMAMQEIILNFLYINLALMIFNLLPIPPLDGSHVLETLLIRKTGPKPFYYLNKYGFLILVALMIIRVDGVNLIGLIITNVSNVVMRGMFWVFDGLLGRFLPWN